MSLLEQTEVKRGWGEDLALGWILLKCSICAALICTRSCELGCPQSLCRLHPISFTALLSNS